MAAKITLEAIREQVVKLFIEQALAAEEKLQERPLTKNERTAFKRGIDRGIRFDLLRDGDWDKAAESLSK